MSAWNVPTETTKEDNSVVDFGVTCLEPARAVKNSVLDRWNN